MTAKALSPFQAAQLATDIADGMSKSKAAIKYGVHRRTIYRTLAREDPELEPQKTKDEDIKPPRKLKPCGTNAAYQRHRRKGEKCPVCWAAHAEEIRLWKLGQNPKKLRKLYTQDADGAGERSA